jgi:hypothetical protein
MHFRSLKTSRLPASRLPLFPDAGIGIFPAPIVGIPAQLVPEARFPPWFRFGENRRFDRVHRQNLLPIPNRANLLRQDQTARLNPDIPADVLCDLAVLAEVVTARLAGDVKIRFATQRA